MPCKIGLGLEQKIKDIASPTSTNIALDQAPEMDQSLGITANIDIIVRVVLAHMIKEITQRIERTGQTQVTNIAARVPMATTLIETDLALEMGRDTPPLALNLIKIAITVGSQDTSSGTVTLCMKK